MRCAITIANDCTCMRDFGILSLFPYHQNFFSKLFRQFFEKTKSINAIAIFGDFHELFAATAVVHWWWWLNGAEALIEWHVFLTYLTWTSRYNSTGLFDAHLFTHEINNFSLWHRHRHRHTHIRLTETTPPFKLVFICCARTQTR